MKQSGAKSEKYTPKNRRFAAIFTIQGVPNAVYPKIFAVAAESGLLNWVVYLSEILEVLKTAKVVYLRVGPMNWIEEYPFFVK